MKLLYVLLAVSVFNVVMSARTYPALNNYDAELMPTVVLLVIIGLAILAQRLPGPVSALKAWIARRKRVLTVLLLAGLVAGGALLVRYYRHEITAYYGSHSINQAVVAYMKANDSRWPRSWDQLAPYLNDSFDHELLQRYWGVAWEIDPAQLYREAPCPASGGIEFIYSRRKHPQTTGPYCFPRSSHGSIEALLRERRLIAPRVEPQAAPLPSP